MIQILNWFSDHLTALVALAAVISSLLNRRKLNALHIELNSRLSQLLATSGASERAQGVLEGRQFTVTEKERVEDRHEEKKQK